MKNKIIRLFVLILPLFYLTQITYANPQKSKTSAELIDIAGQQSMLVHQVLVSYAQIGQVQSYGDPVNTRKVAIYKFEKNLEILKSDKKLIIQVENMQSLWNKLKSIALAPVKKTKMVKLIGFNEGIVELSNEMISELVAGGADHIVNISGQQGMLSQRIALFMLMENWGFDDENYTQKMQLSLDQFYKNFNLLTAYKNNTSQISKSLKSQKKDFIALMSIVYDGKSEADYSSGVSRYTAQILRKSKKTVKLYVKLDNIQSQIGINGLNKSEQKIAKSGN